MKKKWQISFTKEAQDHFAKLLPKGAQLRILKQVRSRLQSRPDVEAGSVKRLSKDRPPYFDEKDVWQLRVGKLRFLYELLPEDAEVIIFFVGKKGTKTTEQMLEDE